MNKNRKCAIVCLLVLGLFGMVLMAPFMSSNMGTTTVFNPYKTYSSAADPTAPVAQWDNFTLLHDTNNVYGGNYYTYQFRTNMTDTDGDISNATLHFETAGNVIYYGLKYDNATNAFSEYYNASYGVESTSSVVGRGTSDWLNVTWKFTIEWAHPDVNTLHAVLTIYDGDDTPHAIEGSDTYDFDTDLVLTDSTFFTYTVYGALEHAGTCSLTYAYEDSGGDNYPLAAQTDFWASKAAVVTVGVEARDYEADTYSESTGVASWTSITMSDTQSGGHTETWSFKAVAQSGGVSDTSLMGTTYSETVEIQTAPPAIRTTRVTGVFEWSEDLTMYLILLVGIGGTSYYAYSRRSVTSKKSPRKRKKSNRRRGR